MSTTTYKQWDIVLVPFPFTDQQQSKKRPGLVVSPNIYNQAGSDIIIVFMTSNLSRSSRPGDYILRNWKSANLPKPTLIRMKFATIARSIIDKRIGRLAQLDQENFKAVLQSFLLGD